ncbi:helix-turn-helix domain-containing protein [Limosilactobacillus vaginalis]|uniref:helix-turn-helix domain-containing protein n=1 Tax=Limosilactobacillus vaginalis TaxID=1633 RepID=UPI00241FA768|nr:helix-turn-helix transcriptional regulator [Limosilactobacillus vaginalis]
MELAEIFSRNLRVRMASMQKKTGDLHKLTGLSNSTISNLQWGQLKGVQFASIAKLASALRCRPEDFFKLDVKWAGQEFIANWREEID